MGPKDNETAIACFAVSVYADKESLETTDSEPSGAGDTEYSVENVHEQLQEAINDKLQEVRDQFPNWNLRSETQQVI